MKPFILKPIRRCPSAKAEKLERMTAQGTVKTCRCASNGLSNTVLYRDYAHPNCMLQSSYRWDGLNFENSSVASKLRPLMKSFLSASEACQLLKYNEFINSNAWVK